MSLPRDDSAGARHDGEETTPHPPRSTPTTVRAAKNAPEERGTPAACPAGRGPGRRRTLRFAAAAALAVILTAGTIALGARHDTNPAAASAAEDPAPRLLATGDLQDTISSTQTHLHAQRKDFNAWATLGLAYVEQARTTGDPSRYPQAQRALQRSLRLRPGNDAALAGRAALAAARHDFDGALRDADQALAVNPYSERALCSRIDALVELGRYNEAARAADQADSRRPGIPVFTRYAYVHELRGDVGTANRVLEQALATATGPGDQAYVATALGQLAWNQGDYPAALRHYAQALRADPNYLPALDGRARTLDASGDHTQAIRIMERVVARYPLPGPLVELGEMYQARGGPADQARARRQYALVDAWTALARAGGVNADLDTALAAADHGDRRAALNAARAEWARRHTVHTADALAWALHVDGRDREAVGYARQATELATPEQTSGRRTAKTPTARPAPAPHTQAANGHDGAPAASSGYRNAMFRYHRGMIEYALGDTEAGRRWLSAALDLNPGFSPLGAKQARAVLAAAK